MDGAGAASGRGAALTVSELVVRLRELLGSGLGEVCVEGEIGSLHRARSGHCYFDLKDDEAQLRAVLFRSAALASGIELEDGMLVRARGRVDVYAPRGALQLVVEAIEPCGEGALRRAFERLKAELQAEGLFDPAHKKPLPRFPRCIGVVTSVHGAAIHDFVRGLRRAEVGVDVLVCDARVQGEGAWRELVRGLHVLDADPRVEVIVLARGGGSLEDLWSFNREELVRAIHELDTPVVSAVGHEIDLVLTDLVADARAPTPTAAAALVVPDGAQLVERVSGLERRMARTMRSRIEALRHRVEAVRRGLVHPAQRLAELRRRLVAAGDRLGRALRVRHAAERGRLEALAARLDALSPLGVLARGYAIVHRAADGAIVRASREVRPGEGIRVRLGRGSLEAQITRTGEDEWR
jgi:exodeoxyribonuclease VII large subunit